MKIESAIPTNLISAFIDAFSGSLASDSPVIGVAESFWVAKTAPGT